IAKAEDFAQWERGESGTEVGDEVVDGEKRDFATVDKGKEKAVEKEAEGVVEDAEDRGDDVVDIGEGKAAEGGVGEGVEGGGDKEDKRSQVDVAEDEGKGYVIAEESWRPAVGQKVRVSLLNS